MFTEVHRVLRPGGRLAIADIAADHTPDLRTDTGTDDAAWAAGVAGPDESACHRKPRR